MEMTLLPTRPREDLRGGVRRGTPFRGPRQIEGRQRGIEMKSEGRRGACLTVRESSELFAVPKETLALEPRHVPLDQPTTVQLQIGRGQDNITRLVWLFPLDEDPYR